VLPLLEQAGLRRPFRQEA